MFRPIACLWALMLVLGADVAFARTPYNVNDPKTSEGWAWQRIRNGDIADLAERTPPGRTTPCGLLDLEKPAPKNDCHVISAQFLVDALTIPKLKTKVGRHGFRLRNARLGTIDFSDVKVPFALSIESSRVDGDLNLSYSLFEKSVSFDGTKITRDFSAPGAKFEAPLYLRYKASVGGNVDLSTATVGSYLEMQGSYFAGDVDLSTATVGGYLAMQDSSFAGNVDLSTATIGSYLLMRGSSFAGDVVLVDATIGNQLVMQGSSFAGNLTLNSAKITGGLSLSDKAVVLGDVDLSIATVGGNLAMPGSTFVGNVALVGAKIGSNVAMQGSSFARNLGLNGAQITGGLLLSDKAGVLGNVDLSTATIGSYLEMLDSSFAGDVVLNGAKIGSDLTMQGSSFARNLGFNGAKITGSLLLSEKARVLGSVDLSTATIGSYLLMRGSSFAGNVGLGGATIGSDLEMQGSSFAGDVVLTGAKITGALRLSTASVGSNMDLSAATLGGDLSMEGSNFAGNVSLNNAQVKGGIYVRGNASVRGDVDLSAATVGEMLTEDSSFGGTVYLEDAQIKGVLFLRAATISGDVDLIAATIGSDLIMERSSFAGNVNLTSAQVKGGLFLRDATVAGINLSGAEITRELDLSRLGWSCPGTANWSGALWFVLTMPPDLMREAPGKPTPDATAEDQSAEPVAKPGHWPLSNSGWRDARCDRSAAPSFDLRNAHVAAFQDSADAWPPVIRLEGFHYDRLGGAGGGERNEMHQRTQREWTDWIERDPIFSAQPYTQLSSVLLAAGDRGKAETIQFAGRDAERRHESNWPTRAWLTVLFLVAGYGIGLYTFLVLGWVILLALIGAGLLWLSPQARAHSFAWRFGASLHRVLPVIELSKDYTNFFDELPQRRIFPRWHKRFLEVYFAGHAIAGYVLGFFLIAAMGGLMPKG